MRTFSKTLFSISICAPSRAMMPDQTVGSVSLLWTQSEFETSAYQRSRRP